MFRLTQETSPSGFDAALESRGYSHEVRTLVMVLDLAEDLARDIQLPMGAKILEREPVSLPISMNSNADTSGRGVPVLLWRGPQVFASLKTINGLACTGMARLENEHLGVFNIRTAQRARRKGYASMLVAYLLTWGQANGATRAFLQVDSENAAAVALYRSFGFAERYTYWHRVAPRAHRG